MKGKVKIPSYVADWLEYCKSCDFTLSDGLIVPDGLIYEASDQLKEWFGSKEYRQNEELFAKAWLYGYIVEEEMYMVKTLDSWFLVEINGKPGWSESLFDSKNRISPKSLFTKEEILAMKNGDVLFSLATEVNGYAKK
ncbi:DUF1642 domain-containing protein [Aerococcaceae bacterium zg-B36]|uniref:DUF1642 domain-containing protein n=1 Tax=Aerococcaceae bacterium zg-252 TaxID=2796928 RepID=UPI001BD8983E|nr:DUF1642 domain-containing protein [Aerococcaceae bacterium zg-B36]